jgi:tetratricopeptide (TPR) repeat protein
MATQRKAKRKLSDISFEKEGAHVALTSKQQGGPANTHDYALVLKANKFSEEFVQKMQQVRVTMELPDFLRKFFSVYYEDAEVLARMMGYEKPEVTEEAKTADYEDYIQSKLEAFEILKSANDAESLSDVLSELDETEYLAMLNDQERIEKALESIEKATQESAPAACADGNDTSTNAGVENIEGVSTSVNKEELEKSKMDDEVKVETVEKAQFELVQKALDEQKVQLQKAMETIAQFEAEKKEAINKAKTEKVKAIVKDESKVEAIAKAALSLESEDDFTAFLAAMEAMMTTVETSEMFVEKGASTQEETIVKESAVAKLLKAKQVK